MITAHDRVASHSSSDGDISSFASDGSAQQPKKKKRKLTFDSKQYIAETLARRSRGGHKRDASTSSNASDESVEEGNQERVEDSAGTDEYAVQLFQGMTMFFLPAGHLGFKQSEVLRRLARKHGATVVEKFTPFVNYVLADTNYETIVHDLKTGSIPPQVRVLKYQWMTDSVEEGSLLAESPYAIMDPSREKELLRTIRETERRERLLASRTSVSSDMDGEGLRETGVADGTGSPVPTYLVEPGASSSSALPYPKHHDSDSDQESHVPRSPETDRASVIGDESTYDLNPHHTSNGFFWQPELKNSVGSQLNKGLLDELRGMFSVYNDIGDEWRKFSYSKAIRAITHLEFKITSVDQVRHVPGIGTSIAQHVHEYLETGHIRKRLEMERSPYFQSIRAFTKIHGVGKGTAKRWYSMGLRTVDDLRARQDTLLTRDQKTALKYYDELQQKMTRQEAAQIEQVVRRAANKIQPRLLVKQCGSYIRGREMVGDADILLTDPVNGVSIEGICTRLVAQLEKEGFITDELGKPSGSEKDGLVREFFMGICQLRPDLPHRRIDILVYPYAQWATGVMGWSGSQMFLRTIRFYADKNGYHLCDRHLLKCRRDSDNKKIDWEPIPVRTEEDIFHNMGLPYIPPTHREG
jgi:DNA polymerase lambda